MHTTGNVYLRLVWKWTLLTQHKVPGHQSEVTVMCPSHSAPTPAGHMSRCEGAPPATPGGLWGDRQLGLRVAVPSKAAPPHWAGPSLALFLTRTEKRDKPLLHRRSWTRCFSMWPVLLTDSRDGRGHRAAPRLSALRAGLSLGVKTAASDRDRSLQTAKPRSRGLGAPKRLEAGDSGSAPGAAIG